MELLPAIDLLGGRVVRLSQGDYEQKQVYSDDPAEVARTFLAAGAKWIHVVDLDAARSGQRTNPDAIRAIAEAAHAGGARVELGGGARTEETIRRMLDESADRVVVGSAAMKDWAWFESLLVDSDLAGRLALGLDARSGKLAAEGWTEQLADSAEAMAAKTCRTGLGAIVYTDIARDGMLSGVNTEATAMIVSTTDVPVIASGGVAGMDDVVACKAAGCAGAIVGRAWYEGRIDLAEAVALARA